MSPADIEYYPVTPERWGDFEALFGPRGAMAGCWCMWWRLKRSEFDLLKGEGNKALMKAIVESGEAPGLLAYEAGQPAGWVSLGPREAFPVLERSRILKRIDEQPVWSVVCFFIAKAKRRQGVSLGLLKAAVAYAGQQGATIVEGYPEEPRPGAAPHPFVFTGLASTFRQAGFVEVARRSETRPIMRFQIDR
jgi:hypothetical protein